MALLAGMESKERVTLLLKLTKLNSEGVIKALYKHLCDGADAENSAIMYSVTAGQVSRALSKLESVNKIVESIKECDWDRFKQNS